MSRQALLPLPLGNRQQLRELRVQLPGLEAQAPLLLPLL